MPDASQEGLQYAAVPVFKPSPINSSLHYLTMSDFLRKNTLLIPLISLKLIRLFGLVIVLSRRFFDSTDPVLVLGDITLLAGLELVVKLEPKYEDVRRLVGVEDLAIVVVVVVVVGPWMIVGLPPLTARAFPTMPCTHASFGDEVVEPYVAARRALILGPAAPSGV